MLLEKSYDQKIDVWALGILLYEMVHGDAPYGEDTPIPQKMDFIKKNKEFDYDQTLSTDLLDLIKKILQPDPELRIGMAEIFSHEWMKKFEKNYGIDISSFVRQNQRDANTQGTFSSAPSDQDTQSEKSVQSSLSTKDFKTSSEPRTRALYQDKDTLNYGDPDGKQDFLWLIRSELMENYNKKRQRAAPLMRKSSQSKMNVKAQEKDLPAQSGSIWAGFLTKLGCIKRPD